MPELRQLRTFVAVAHERNFTRAAQRLHLAQQAVSKTIAQLERELGVTLLERTTREVSLTEAGRAFLVDAQALVAGADAAFARVRDHARGRAGTITVGVSPAVGHRVLDDLARASRAEMPSASIALRVLHPAEIASSLREHRVDLVVARTPSPLDPGREVIALAPTRAALIVPADHRLASAGPTRLAAIDGERLLTWSPVGTPYTDFLVDLCRRSGATVTAVESAITGAPGLVDLVDLEAVAIVAEGGSSRQDSVELPLEPAVMLPLFAVVLAGEHAPAVARLLSILAEPLSLR